MDRKEMVDILREEREDTDRRIYTMMENFKSEIKTDIALAHAEMKENTRAMITDILPFEHGTDHDAVKMLRRWGTSFLSGLFGNMGRAIFIIVMLGIGIQVLNPKVATPVVDALIGAPK